MRSTKPYFNIRCPKEIIHYSSDTISDMTVRQLNIILLILAFPFFYGCMKKNGVINSSSKVTIPSQGVFIINEGNFMYGNATLSVYDPATRVVQNDIFNSINSLPLGDVAQSMVIQNGLGYIVINNSGKIYVINTTSGKYVGKITGLTSPRYMHFESTEKCYVTDLYAAKISIVNPTTYQVTGSILTPGHASTEQMVQFNEFLFVSCWSYDNTVLVINTKTDQVVDSIKTGIQPGGLVMDKFSKIWVLCDGGWVKSGSGGRIPMLQRIDPFAKTIDESFSLTSDANPSRLAINSTGDSLLFINAGIWKFGVNQTNVGDHPFLAAGKHLYYSLAVDPKTSEIYLSDVIDYQQDGIIYRYSAQGARIDSFKAGIIPGSFCFK